VLSGVTLSRYDFPTPSRLRNVLFRSPSQFAILSRFIYIHEPADESVNRASDLSLEVCLISDRNNSSCVIASSRIAKLITRTWKCPCNNFRGKMESLDGQPIYLTTSCAPIIVHVRSAWRTCSNYRAAQAAVGSEGRAFLNDTLFDDGQHQVAPHDITGSAFRRVLVTRPASFDVPLLERSSLNARPSVRQC
jgi:hypothetical protein